jgi:hypothetical protein
MSKNDSNQDDKKTMLDWALDYARRGWKVFPLFHVLKGGGCSCRPRPNHPCKRIGKHPMTKNGVVDATTDEATIRQWWTETPHANIGFATGHNGRVVIDIDDGPKKDKEGKLIGKKKGSESLKALVDANGELPETLTVETGSGGRHYHFLSIHEIKNSASKVAEDIDIRGAGGYVILPPSNHESGGKYRWVTDPAKKIEDIPEWLEKRCLGSSKVDISSDNLQEEVAKDAKRTADEARKFTERQLKILLGKIPPDCDRDTWWQVGAALKKELGDDKGYSIWDEWSKKAKDKYDPKVMPVQWNSFKDEGITGGTIFV